MAVVDGGELRVYIGGTPIAFATSSTINLTSQVDELAPTSVSDASFTVVKPRRRSISISTNALYGASTNYDFKDLYDAWKAGTSVTIAFKTTTTGEWEVSGTAYVTGISASASVSQDASVRATFTISGETSITVIP